TPVRRYADIRERTLETKSGNETWKRNLEQRHVVLKLGRSLSCPHPALPRMRRAIACGTAPLRPLPACHQGVYAHLRRAMERVAVRGRFHRLRLAETPPHPAASLPSPARGGG